MRARSALFTLFGDIVRPAGGDAWLTTVTACMGALGFTPEATRTALHRMAAEGWVALTRVGRFSAYRLTEPGVERLEEAAARIYRLRAAPWDGRWHLLVCPDAGRNQELARELQWRGHGQLPGNVWISPHPQGRRLDQLLAAHGATETSLRFERADTDDPAANSRVVAAAWDLTELHAAHRAFLDRWENADAPAQPQAAFVHRINLVHHWRSFLFLDPGLPDQVLPDDWLGNRAAAVFRTQYDAVDDAAWTFYDALAADAPALTRKEIA